MASGRRQGKPIQQKDAGGKKASWTVLDLQKLDYERQKNPPTPYKDISENCFTHDGVVRHNPIDCHKTWEKNFRTTDEDGSKPSKRAKRVTQQPKAGDPQPVEAPRNYKKRKRATEEKANDEAEPDGPVKKSKASSKAATKKAEDHDA